MIVLEQNWLNKELLKGKINFVVSFFVSFSGEILAVAPVAHRTKIVVGESSSCEDVLWRVCQGLPGLLAS